jgi:hypothetical protein
MGTVHATALYAFYASGSLNPASISLKAPEQAPSRLRGILRDSPENDRPRSIGGRVFEASIACCLSGSAENNSSNTNEEDFSFDNKCLCVPLYFFW